MFDFLKAPEEVTGIIKHDAGMFMLFNQLMHKIRHPLIATQEYRRVMVIPHLWMREHKGEIADERSGTHIIGACRYGRLVHMKGDAKAGVQAVKVKTRAGYETRRRGGQLGTNPFFITAQD